MDSQYGSLFVVATPIGNLEDISQRALSTLQSADRILAEDTRRTQQLLTHFGIKGSLTAIHDHNERQQVDKVIAWLSDGLNLAMVSDAGTPLISDPGYHLVNRLRTEGYTVVPIPGPSAIITALSAAGLPTDRFAFEGFLPAKSTSRRKVIEALQNESRTLVFYESSHRIIDSLSDFAAIIPDREMVLARELTKRFETFLQGTTADLLDRVSNDENQTKGEFVLMLKGNDSPKEQMAISADKLLDALVPHLPTKLASQITADMTGESKKALYQKALERKK